MLNGQWNAIYGYISPFAPSLVSTSILVQSFLAIQHPTQGISNARAFTMDSWEFSSQPESLPPSSPPVIASSIRTVRSAALPPLDVGILVSMLLRLGNQRPEIQEAVGRITSEWYERLSFMY